MKVIRPTTAEAMPRSISRMSMNRNPSADTSPRVSDRNTSRAAGPAIESPHHPVPRACTVTEPSPGRCRWSQRRWYSSAGPEPAMKKPRAPRFASVKSPMTLPSSLSIGASTMRPSRGMRLASIRSSHPRAPGPVTRYFANPEVSVRPTRSRTARHSAPTCSKSTERRQENTSSTPGGANQRGVSSPHAAPNCAPASRSRS